ncbi:MAG: hypothetical protein GF310_13810 [candidate division Zixibacteria bacterium]|nr:hypothetical protein [candidate division Zixibacteria bacterium]
MNSRTSTVIYIVFLLVVAFYAIGLLFPAYWNWGIIGFAGYEIHSLVFLSAIVLLAVVPTFGKTFFNTIFGFLQKFVILLSTLPKAVRFVLWIIIPATILYLLKSNSLIFGDGVSFASSIIEETMISPNTYVYSFFLIQLSNLFGFTEMNQAANLMSYFSIMFGIIFFYYLYKLMRAALKSSLNTLPLYLMIISSSIVVLFMGYVESYPLLAGWLMVYFYTAISYLKESSGIISLLLVFIIGAALHLWFIAFLPSLLFAINQRKQIVPSKIVVVVSAIYIICIYVAGQIMYRGEMQLTLPILANSNTGYTLFSGYHILDMLNELIMIGPILPIIGVIALASSIKSDRNEIHRFFIYSAVPAFLFAFMLDPLIGALRDWDLLSIFGAPLMFSAVIFFYDLRKKRAILINLIAAILLFNVFHTSAFINAMKNEDRAVQHVVDVLLEDPHYNENYYSGCRIRPFANILTGVYKRPEDAMKFYNNIGDYSSLGYFDLVSAANSFYNVGDYKQAEDCYEMAVEEISLAPNHRFAFGHSLVLNKNFERAVEVLKPMLGDTSFTDLYFLIGVSYANQYALDSSTKYLEIALYYSSQKREVLRTYVNIFESLKQFGLAAQYQKRVFNFMPSSTAERIKLIELFERAGMSDSARYYRNYIYPQNN